MACISIYYVSRYFIGCISIYLYIYIWLVYLYTMYLGIFSAKCSSIYLLCVLDVALTMHTVLFLGHESSKWSFLA